MKKLLILLLGISFLILLSFSSNTEKTVVFSTEIQFEQEGCPECTAQFKECTKPFHKVYTDAVEKAADKRKADSITKEEYKDACARASLVRDKGLRICATDYKKCCLEETRKNQNKQKRLEGNSNTIL